MLIDALPTMAVEQGVHTQVGVLPQRVVDDINQLQLLLVCAEIE